MRSDAHTVGQTEITKITVAFRNFANKPNMAVKTTVPYLYHGQDISPCIPPVYLHHTYAGNRSLRATVIMSFL
jgi:hypothetical protein